MGSLASAESGRDALRFKTCGMGNGCHNSSFLKSMVPNAVWDQSYNLVGDRNFSKDVPVSWNFGAWIISTGLESENNFLGQASVTIKERIGRLKTSIRLKCSH